MVECAIGRQESRGLHYNSDFPNARPVGKDSVLVPAHFDEFNALMGPWIRRPPTAFERLAPIHENT